MAISWDELAEEAPVVHEVAREHLRSGIAWLATIRADGTPRLHAVTPQLAAGLHVLVAPRSPKLADLRRDPRCTLHAAVGDDDGSAVEVSLRCLAVILTGDDEATLIERLAPGSGYAVVRLDPTHVLVIANAPAGATITRWPTA